MRAAGADARPGGRRQGWWNVASRLVGAAGTLALVPMASRALGEQEFAVWLVLSTLAAVLAFSDLGIANATVTDLTVAAARGDDIRFRSLVTAATVGLAGAGCVLVGLAVLVPAVIDIHSALGLDSRVSDLPASTAVTVYLAALALSLPLSMGVRVLAALHRSDITSRAIISATAIQCALGLFATMSSAGLLVFVALAAAPAVLSGAFAWVAALKLHPPCRPRLGATDRRSVRKVLRRGGAYWTISLAAAIGFETDAFVIAHALGSTAGADYVVPARLFLFVPALFTVFFSPLWPEVARANASGDLAGLTTMLKKSVRTAVIWSAVAATALLVLARPVVELLSPGTQQPSVGLLVTLGALTVVHSSSAPVAAFLSGLNLVGIQAASATAMALVNIVASVILVRSLGSVGPPLATVACQALISLLPLALLVTWRLRPQASAASFLESGRA